LSGDAIGSADDKVAPTPASYSPQQQ